ncbi:hypothetical protein HRbin19_00443 [bacterium HR19]|nr:hypothetical protein HRbin19_00443 [bacterium HR19]
MWHEWKDEELSKDPRYKLLFIRSFGEAESEFMEKGVFGRKGIETLTQRYMPVKVDAEERPDIFLRYALKTTPTVIILTRDGKIIGGGNFCDYDTFIKFMVELGTLITKQKHIIENIAAEDIKEDDEENFSEPESEFINQVSSSIPHLLDKILNSSLISPKILFLGLDFFIKNGDEAKARKVIELLSKAEDKIEGGLFSSQSFENPTKFSTQKSSLINAKYALLLKKFYEKFKDEEINKKFAQQFEFLKTFYNQNFFINKIAEDEEYYKSTKSIRDIRQKPQRDERLFFDLNLEIAEILVEMGEIEDARKITDYVISELVEVSGDEIKIFHSNKKDTFNLLCDVSQGIITLYKIYKETKEEKYRKLIAKFEKVLNSKKGDVLYFDFNKNGFGALKKKKIDIFANIKVSKYFEFIGEKERAEKIKRLLLPYAMTKDTFAFLYALL